MQEQLSGCQTTGLGVQKAAAIFELRGQLMPGRQFFLEWGRGLSANTSVLLSKSGCLFHGCEFPRLGLDMELFRLLATTSLTFPYLFNSCDPFFGF